MVRIAVGVRFLEIAGQPADPCGRAAGDERAPEVTQTSHQQVAIALHLRLDALGAAAGEDHHRPGQRRGAGREPFPQAAGRCSASP